MSHQWLLYSEPKEFFSSSVIFCIIVNIDNHFFFLKYYFFDLCGLPSSRFLLFLWFLLFRSLEIPIRFFSFLFLDGPLHTHGKNFSLGQNALLSSKPLYLLSYWIPPPFPYLTIIFLLSTCDQAVLSFMLPISVSDNILICPRKSRNQVWFFSLSLLCLPSSISH